jgi:roadblock/LC7 domain-containing protein
VEYKANMDMSKEMAEMTAQFCATISMMFNTLDSACNGYHKKYGHTLIVIEP